MLLSPRLEIHTKRIEENARHIIDLCHKHGAQAACVSKVLCAHPAVLKAFEKASADMIADSRTANLANSQKLYPQIPRLCLRPPAPSQAANYVEFADYSLNSSLDGMIALSEAALKAGKTHNVILMIDVGDLREGVWPTRAAALAQQAAQLKGIKLVGVGCNLACYGGVIPSLDNMATLIETRDACRKATGLPLDLISGGNSSSMPLLMTGTMPKEINHFRVGESVIHGRNVLDRSPLAGTRQDTLIFAASIIEIEEKPSVPIGETGQDAFGNHPSFIDRGLRKRALLNTGRQDVVPEGLETLDPGIIVLGASSDHLVLDISDAATNLKVGDEVAFYPSYGATLAAATSSFVQKIAIEDEE